MTAVIVHDPDRCAGSFCPWHNPSNHHMREWTKIVRADPFAYPLTERICMHGIGHPDPDSVTYLESISGPGSRGAWGMHGCDGCCRPDGDAAKEYVHR